MARARQWTGLASAPAIEEIELAELGCRCAPHNPACRICFEDRARPTKRAWRLPAWFRPFWPKSKASTDLNTAEYEAPQQDLDGLVEMRQLPAAVTSPPPPTSPMTIPPPVQEVEGGTHAASVCG
jgi:hypothetical protein